jgi:uncharacterized membrane protein YvbJ
MARQKAANEIDCPNCGNFIHRNATECFHCGYKIIYNHTNIQTDFKYVNKKTGNSHLSFKKVSGKTIFISIIAILVFMILIRALIRFL